MLERARMRLAVGLFRTARRLQPPAPPAEPGDRVQDRANLNPHAVPGPVVTEAFERLRHVPGWFTLDDCGHWEMLLGTQRVLGLRGNLLEIGCFHGRSAIMLARHLGADEHLHLCDMFEAASAAEDYDDYPTPAQLRDTVTAATSIATDHLAIHACPSEELAGRLPDDARFRFVHVDGGHTYAVALGDIRLAAERLVAGGVICVDDYENRLYPEVTRAVDDVLAEGDVEVVADLNRHGAGGRKIYLGRPAS